MARLLEPLQWVVMMLNIYELLTLMILAFLKAISSLLQSMLMIGICYMTTIFYLLEVGQLGKHSSILVK